MPSAAITNYAHLYARGYYAHATDVTSFDAERLPPIVARRAAEVGHAVVDIGGGNGALSERLAVHGTRAVTLDAQARDSTARTARIAFDFDRRQERLLRSQLVVPGAHRRDRAWSTPRRLGVGKAEYRAGCSGSGVVAQPRRQPALGSRAGDAGHSHFRF